MAKLAHAQWSSRMGFVLAAAGSAVGLGNIWRFSYMVGDSGGAAFVLVYLACVALVGLPILVAEWMIGRRGQKNPINTMADLAASHGQTKAWAAIGVSGVLAAFLILSFYSVIGGWSLNYTLGSVIGTFNGQDADSISALFGGMLGSPMTLLLWHTAFMVLVIGIVARGVTKGLESAARTMMPALVVLMLILVGYGMTSGHFGEALSFMFSPDWAALDGGVVLAAMGQAFFTLSLGMGIMMAYGSYLGEDVNLISTARTVIILDTAIALLAGLAIFPIVFANGLSAGEGPGLIFVTLPLAFGNMTGGTILGLMFFPAAHVCGANLGYLAAGACGGNPGRAHVDVALGSNVCERYCGMGVRRCRAALVQRVVGSAVLWLEYLRPARYLHQQNPAAADRPGSDPVCRLVFRAQER